MTETHSLGEWEKEFDKKFAGFYSPLTGPSADYVKTERIKEYIKSLLIAQKEGFRREIAAGIKPCLCPPGGNACGVEDANKVLNDLLTKLDTNSI